MPFLPGLGWCRIFQQRATDRRGTFFTHVACMHMRGGGTVLTLASIHSCLCLSACLPLSSMPLCSRIDRPIDCRCDVFSLPRLSSQPIPLRSLSCTTWLADVCLSVVFRVFLPSSVTHFLLACAARLAGSIDSSRPSRSLPDRLLMSCR